MAREYHLAAVGGSNDDEVSVDLADVLNALGAQNWELKAAVPLKDSDTLQLAAQIGHTPTPNLAQKAGRSGSLRTHQRIVRRPNAKPPMWAK
jgi:hypothetical protein